MQKFYKMMLVLGLGLILSACGFRLREPPTFTTKLQSIYINTTTPNDPFVQTLKRSLIANNVNVVDAPTAATATLNLISIQTSNTMTASGGVSTSGFYTAYLTVSFSVTDAHGNYLIQPNTLQQSQNFTSNATQVLSGNLVASQLADQMDLTIADGILSQLAQVNS